MKEATGYQQSEERIEEHHRGQMTENRKEWRKKEQLRTKSVLFIEYKKGGDVQKEIRETLDRVGPILMFNMLSNKDFCSGQPCGRESCRTCKQLGDRKAACTRKNVVCLVQS